MNAQARPPQAQHLAKAAVCPLCAVRVADPAERCPECGADVRLSRKEARAELIGIALGEQAAAAPVLTRADKARGAAWSALVGVLAAPGLSSSSTSPPSVQDRVFVGLGLLAALCSFGLGLFAAYGAQRWGRLRGFAAGLIVLAIAEVIYAAYRLSAS